MDNFYDVNDFVVFLFKKWRVVLVVIILSIAAFAGSRAVSMIGSYMAQDETTEAEAAPVSNPDSTEPMWVKIQNDIAVASRFAASWIFFSATQIYTYTYKFDMTSDDVWETTRDFFYQDITSFVTQERVVERIDKHLVGCLKKGIQAEKNNYIVNSLRIVVPNDSFSFSMRNNETLEQSLQAAKAMLRERKFVK